MMTYALPLTPSEFDVLLKLLGIAILGVVLYLNGRKLQKLEQAQAELAKELELLSSAYLSSQASDGGAPVPVEWPPTLDWRERGDPGRLDSLSFLDQLAADQDGEA